MQKCHIPNVEEISKPTLKQQRCPPSVTKYGSLVWPHAQIVAVRLHCTMRAPFGLHVRVVHVHVLLETRLSDENHDFLRAQTCRTIHFIVVTIFFGGIICPKPTGMPRAR